MRDFQEIMKMPEIISGNKGEVNESKLHDYTRSSVGIRFIISEYIYGKTFRDQNWQVVRARENKKIFLWIYERNGYVNLNVKADPEWRDFWRSAYESVQAGYHQNKEHWNTIILNGTVPDKDIKRMISESYDLVTYSPTKKIYEAVKQIPKGCVATYGQVAEMAGNPRMSRAVGNALHKNPDPEHIPCYRVVNFRGELSGAFAFGGKDVQKKLLEADGIEVVNGTVDLKKYGLAQRDDKLWKNKNLQQ